MLPIAAEIAGRMTRDHAQSALPHARQRPQSLSRPRRARAARPPVTVTILRRLAATSGALADRLDRGQASHAQSGARS